MADERWMPVAGFEGYYEVSDRGRVRSLSRRFSRVERVMVPFVRKDGYKLVQLRKDGRREGKLVHRLVAEAFIPNPDMLPVVNHKNENPSDNRVENLEWCDQKYNANYGTAQSRKAEKVSKRVSAKDEDGRILATFRSQSVAESMTGISQNAISMCVHGLQKTAGGYSWERA